MLVVDSRHEQEPDEWLQQIRHTAGLKNLPPVHIITNIYERCDRKQNETRLKALYTGELDFYYFACNELESDELTVFKQALLNSASTQRHSVTKRLVDAGEHLAKTLKHDPVISIAALRKQVRKTFKEDELSDTLKQLEGLGYLVPANDQRKKYCLNPTWTIDHAYQFLHMPVVQSSEGLLDQDVFADKALELSETIAEKLEDKDYPKLNEQRIEYLESFIQGSGVCVALDQTRQFFFPDVAPTNEPEKYIKPVAECRAVIEFILPYIPIGLSAQLVCHWMQQTDINISTPNDVWREGFVLRNSQNENSFLIIRYQHRKAVISVDCFGEQEPIAALLKNFWAGLQEKINPIQADDVTPLIRMDQVILERNKHLVKATEWLDDASKIVATLDQIERLKHDVERGKTVTNNTMNNYGTMGIVSFGNENEIEQKDVVFTSFKEENHKELLLQAIQQVRVDYVHDLKADHHQQLVIMENQVNAGELQESWYQTLLPDLTKTAEVITVVAGIAGLLGLL